MNSTAAIEQQILTIESAIASYDYGDALTASIALQGLIDARHILKQALADAQRAGR